MNKITKLRKLFNNYKIDGYIVPKNDEFFGEYVKESKDNLKFISNFSGSYGFALILKKDNYLFVDGRYTLQAKIQSGKEFKIITIPKNKIMTITNASTEMSSSYFNIASNYDLKPTPLWNQNYKVKKLTDEDNDKINEIFDEIGEDEDKTIH